MDATTHAYLAGIVDGEGYVGIRRTYGKRTGHFQGFVRVRMTDRAALDMLHATYGGSINPYSVEGNRKPGWLWQVRSRAASVALDSMRPYLRVKNEQADLVIRLQDTMAPQRLDPATIEERESIYGYISSLNRRGAPLPEGP
jgi:hypothetical protein